MKRTPGMKKGQSWAKPNPFSENKKKKGYGAETQWKLFYQMEMELTTLP